MRINNPVRSSFKVESRDPAQVPTGIVEIVGDYFPIFHAVDSAFFCSPHGNDKVI
jgi:hypothetical protein